MNTKDKGSIGEEIAAKYLLERGYKILERNFERKYQQGGIKGEIDIVARKGGVIVFVEVKTSFQKSGMGGNYWFPEQRVDRKKQFHLIRASENWLEKQNLPLDSPWQIDIVVVLYNPVLKKARIRHLKNAVGMI